MGPWTLGRAGLSVNIIAACFLLISVFSSFFPPIPPVAPLTMKWLCAVFGGVVIIGLIWHGIFGRKVYNGPITERSILLTDHDRNKESEYSD
jgi:choline transport protein